MLARESTNVVAIATPGTWSGGDRSDLANGEQGVHEGRDEQADGELARRSRSSRCTMRGENWPMASCTTTRTIVRTRTVRLTIDVATVVRTSNAASGPPMRSAGTS